MSDRFFLGEAATQRKAYPESGEKLRRSANDSDLLGGSRLADDFAPLHVNRQARKGRDVTAPFVVVGQRGAVIFDAGFRIGVEDRNKPIGLRKRKRTEQNGIDHRKDREVRPETDCDRGERGDRKRRRFAELAKGEAKIVHEQNYSARKAVTCSEADIGVYSLVIDTVLELPLVFGAVEMAF